MNLWGYHHLAYHLDKRDWEIMEGAQSFTMFENWWQSPLHLTTALCVTVPGAPIYLRNWGAIDDPMKGQMNAMIADPERTGERHADWWAEWLKPLGVPTDRLYCCPLNEPNTTLCGPQIDRYNTAFLRRLYTHGLRGAAGMFSVGHPHTIDGTPHTKPNWATFRGMLTALKETGGRLSLHEYGMPDNHGTEGEAGPYWVGRFVHLLDWLSVEDPWLADHIAIDITEHGIDLHVGDGEGNRGFLAAGMGAERYLEWLNYSHKWYSQYPQIKSVQVFTWDSNDDWATFDIRRIREQWAAMVWEKLPSVWINGEKPHKVYVPVITVSEPDEASWEKFQRCLPFIWRWEGELSTDPNDPGNWYNGQLIGTKYGISAASWAHLYDIPNLTRDQAEQIYYKHYWLASGADKLDWPACLLALDTAILHGASTLALWTNQIGTDGYALAAKRLKTYVKSGNWERYGKAWVERTAELLEKMAA